ncbi:hypothetical protein HX866_22555 [Pseudomonas gingeri]|uniref:hypothetical protein n=1 Tax=Pseudomonas gingeri TaxID=117681 RepID=UPI0015A0444E|nr:hypothetical protein [Pseudomonas gingeri]NWA27674.1 hypothetical protein [Pseudomonas gingeri]
MKKIITLALIYTASTMAEEISYRSIFEVDSKRFGNTVVRYLISRDNYPCLNVEILDPEKNWSISSRKKFCRFEGKSLRADFTDADFENIRFSKIGIETTLSITPLALTGEEHFICLIPIESNRIGNLSCSRQE